MPDLIGKQGTTIVPIWTDPSPVVKPGPTGWGIDKDHPYEEPTTASRLAAAESWSYSPWLHDLTQKAVNGDQAAYDKLINYYMTLDSERTAREWTAKREDTAYTRMMEDFKRAGISPYILSGGAPSVSSYYGKSYSGSQMTSQANNEATTGTSALRGLMTIFGMLIAAMLAA